MIYTLKLPRIKCPSQFEFGFKTERVSNFFLDLFFSVFFTEAEKIKLMAEPVNLI